MSAASPMSGPRATNCHRAAREIGSRWDGARVATECRMSFPSIVPAETVSGAPNPTGAVGGPARVIGLGTPFGDDRAGWEVVARLRNVLPVGTRADATSDPLVVLDTRPEDGLLVVIDAC